VYDTLLGPVQLTRSLLLFCDVDGLGMRGLYGRLPLFRLVCVRVSTAY